MRACQTCHPKRLVVREILYSTTGFGYFYQGRQFDKDGNLVDWWAKDTQRRYLEKARCIIEQYGNYTAKQVDMKVRKGYARFI